MTVPQLVCVVRAAERMEASQALLWSGAVSAGVAPCMVGKEGRQHAERWTRAVAKCT
jgi:hypothetical protein